jgi:hypothetical protein
MAGCGAVGDAVAVDMGRMKGGQANAQVHGIDRQRLWSLRVQLRRLIDPAQLNGETRVPGVSLIRKCRDNQRLRDPQIIGCFGGSFARGIEIHVYTAAHPPQIALRQEMHPVVRDRVGGNVVGMVRAGEFGEGDAVFEVVDAGLGEAEFEVKAAWGFVSSATSLMSTVEPTSP